METDLKKIVADGVSLSDLQRLRDAEVDEFAALVSRKDLASLGLPTKKKHRSTITNLIAAIYKRAPAIDVLAQSHAVLSITWSITRLLLQVRFSTFLGSSSFALRFSRGSNLEPSSILALAFYLITKAQDER